ncbi:MAG: AAA family ATPase [bacterium P3]|nr:MAG: AAA family ATPase [bacterium P3]KWW31565.1 MAG: AAA family ATPase [bacterium F083]
MKTLSYFGYALLLANIVLLFFGWWWLLLSIPLTYLCFRYDIVYMHWVGRKIPVIKKDAFLATVGYSSYCTMLRQNVFSQWWASRYLTLKKLQLPQQRLLYLAALDLMRLYLRNGGSRTDLYNERGANLLVLVDMLYKDYTVNEAQKALSVVQLRSYYSKYLKPVRKMLSAYDTIKARNEAYDVEENGFYKQVAEAANEGYVVGMEQFFEAANAALQETNQVLAYEEERKRDRSRFIQERITERYNGDEEDNDDNYFENVDTAEEGNESDPFDLKPKTKPTQEEITNNEKVNIEDVIKELNGLTGLDSVKNELQTFINTIKVQNKKKAMNLPVQTLSYHCVFTGSPGTGKTTVARILAKAFKALGLISKGNLIESSRKDFIGGYMGQTAIKTNQLLDRAKGNVLFIDEAYQLVSGDNDSFGEEAVAELIARMENDRNDLIVVIAGYDAEISKFLSTNPGLKSRFNRYIHFEDYHANELAHIFYTMAKSKSYMMSIDVVEVLKQLMNDANNRRGKDFGNARYVRNFFEKCVEEQANRLAASASLEKEELLALTADDLSKAFRKVNI